MALFRKALTLPAAAGSAVRAAMAALRQADYGAHGDRQFLFYVPLAAAVFVYLHRHILTHPDWIPIHDTLTQFTEFLYTYSAVQQGELPLWNSYLYGGQPFYLMMNHGLLLDPLLWLWMTIGTLAGLTPLKVYVLTHLTGILFFAAGGFVLVKEVTKSIPGAVAAFMVLLYSGEAIFWVNQVYSLAIVEAVPWVVWSALRYRKHQTLPRALVFGVLSAIALNRYYPVYLMAFGLSALLLALLLYFRDVASINWGRLARHAAVVVPLVAVLVLPTYLSYAEMTSDNYQISRFSGPEQKEPDPAISAGGKELLAFAGTFVKNTFALRTTEGEFSETVPFIGIPAVLFLLYALLSRTRSAAYWGFLLLLTALHYAGTTTPFIYVDYLLMPYYKLMRTFGYYSGYVTLSAAVLSGIGMMRLSGTLSRPSSSRDRTDQLGLPAALLFTAAIVFIFPAGNMAVSVASLSALAVILLAARLKVAKAREGAVLVHLLLLVVLAASATNLFVGRGDLNRIQTKDLLIDDLFTYSSEFHFSFERPGRYTIRQPMVFLFNNGECCVTFLNIAEKFDGPHFFDLWGSPHTLYVDRNYYHFSAVSGFQDLMKKKLHFFRNYAVADDVADYGELLGRSVLVLDDDAGVRNPDGRVAIDRVLSMPLVSAPRRDVALIAKTANTVRFQTTTDENSFLLYTDLYHKGFSARIDGREVPLLRGMGTFKAVELPAGRHVVEFSFEPAYRYALAAYLIVIAGFAAAVLLYSARIAWRVISQKQTSKRLTGRKESGGR